AIGANYAGTNILATDETSVEVVSSYNRASDGSISVGTISIDLTNIKLFAAGGATGGLADAVMQIDISPQDPDSDPTTPPVQVTDAQITGYLNDIEETLAAITTAAAELGAAK